MSWPWPSWCHATHPVIPMSWPWPSCHATPTQWFLWADLDPCGVMPTHPVIPMSWPWPLWYTTPTQWFPTADLDPRGCHATHPVIPMSWPWPPVPMATSVRGSRRLPPRVALSAPCCEMTCLIETPAGQKKNTWNYHNQWLRRRWRWWWWLAVSFFMPLSFGIILVTLFMMAVMTTAWSEHYVVQVNVAIYIIMSGSCKWLAVCFPLWLHVWNRIIDLTWLANRSGSFKARDKFWGILIGWSDLITRMGAVRLKKIKYIYIYKGKGEGG